MLRFEFRVRGAAAASCQRRRRRRGLRRAIDLAYFDCGRGGGPPAGRGPAGPGGRRAAASRPAARPPSRAAASGLSHTRTSAGTLAPAAQALATLSATGTDCRASADGQPAALGRLWGAGGSRAAGTATAALGDCGRDWRALAASSNAPKVLLRILGTHVAECWAAPILDLYRLHLCRLLGAAGAGVQLGRRALEDCGGRTAGRCGARPPGSGSPPPTPAAALPPGCSPPTAAAAARRLAPSARRLPGSGCAVAYLRAHLPPRPCSENEGSAVFPTAAERSLNFSAVDFDDARARSRGRGMEPHARFREFPGVRPGSFRGGSGFSRFVVIRFLNWQLDFENSLLQMRIHNLGITPPVYF